MDQRTLDDFSLEHDHAKPVHPLRALLDNHFFVGKYCCTDGALWIVLMDALLFVPLIMAAFFYPWQALMVGVVLLAVSFAGYEGFMLWQRRHPDFHL